MTELNRYENGKIYKLVSNHTDKIYIGSTCKERLCQRLAKHKEHYKRWLITNTNFLTSFELFKLGDVEIILLENVNCRTKDELHAKEREYIEKYKDIILNKNIPLRTVKEYREQNKDKIKEKMEKKKEINKIKQKEYREQNKDKIKIKCKEKYQKNKDHVKEKVKEWNELNKDKIKEKNKIKILCICGTEYTKSHISRHNKTKKHINFVLELEQQTV